MDEKTLANREIGRNLEKLPCPTPPDDRSHKKSRNSSSLMNWDDRQQSFRETLIGNTVLSPDPFIELCGSNMDSGEESNAVEVDTDMDDLSDLEAEQGLEVSIVDGINSLMISERYDNLIAKA